MVGGVTSSKKASSNILTIRGTSPALPTRSAPLRAARGLAGGVIHQRSRRAFHAPRCAIAGCLPCVLSAGQGLQSLSQGVLQRGDECLFMLGVRRVIGVIQCWIYGDTNLMHQPTRAWRREDDPAARWTKLIDVTHPSSSSRSHGSARHSLG